MLFSLVCLLPLCWFPRPSNLHHCALDIDAHTRAILTFRSPSNLDILKSALALVVLRKKLVRRVAELDIDDHSPLALRSRDCMDVLREARAEACEIFPQFLRELTKRGWRPPLRSMLGRVSARAEWTIQRK